jgi:hypothetical protein
LRFDGNSGQDTIDTVGDRRKNVLPYERDRRTSALAVGSGGKAYFRCVEAETTEW